MLDEIKVTTKSKEQTLALSKWFSNARAVIVAKIAEIGPGSGYGGPPNINWSDVRLDIPRSKIIKVELDKFFIARSLPSKRARYYECENERECNHHSRN